MNAGDGSNFSVETEADPWDVASTALFDTANPILRQAEPVELGKFIDNALLRDGCPVSWREFAQSTAVPDRPKPFVYDRVAKLVFIGGFGVHETIAACIYATRHIECIGGWRELLSNCMGANRSDYADRFVMNGMGFICGGPSAQMGRKTLMIGKGVRMTPEERRVLCDYRLEVIE